MAFTAKWASVILVATTLAACGDGGTGPEMTLPAVEGVWRATQAGVEETTLELGADGTVQLVEADLPGRACYSSSGTWTSDDGRLVLGLTGSEGGGGSDVRAYDYEVSDGSLVLTTGGLSTTFFPAPSVPSCLSYGFGRWEGTLRARIDDVVWSFSNISVDTQGIEAGRLEILACLDTAPACALENVVLRLRVTAPGTLAPGSYPLGDQSSGFYGLVNPFPGDPDFPGFDSLRLTPTGSFLLLGITATSISASFEFRANERATNAPPAPDGSTFAQVTDGVIELVYR